MMARARLLLPCTLIACLALLAGCASWGGDDWREPEVHLVEVETVKARLLEQEFVLHLRVDNPNDSRLFIRNLSYAIRLNDLLLVQDQASVWRSVGGTPGAPSRSPRAPTVAAPQATGQAAQKQAAAALHLAGRTGDRVGHPSGPALIAQW